jgi:hypothetical protein
MILRQKFRTRTQQLIKHFVHKRGHGKSLFFCNTFSFKAETYRPSISSGTCGNLDRNPDPVLTVFENAPSRIRWGASKGRSAVWTKRFQCRCSDRSRSGSCSLDPRRGLSLLKLAMARTRCSEAAARLLQWSNKKKKSIDETLSARSVWSCSTFQSRHSTLWSDSNCQV